MCVAYVAFNDVMCLGKTLERPCGRGGARNPLVFWSIFMGVEKKSSLRIPTSHPFRGKPCN